MIPIAMTIAMITAMWHLRSFRNLCLVVLWLQVVQ